MLTPKVQMPLRLDPKLAESFKAKCRDGGRTLTGTVRVLIQKWLDGSIDI